MISGFTSGPPILISPESAAGIKAGAKTGLSTLICGILFAIACFFSPLFAAVPAAGTAPLLLAVGVVLFGNVRRIDWSSIKEAIPAYCCLFFIPFTYSILRGIGFGYVMYIIMGIFTGDLYYQGLEFWNYYKDSFTFSGFTKISPKSFSKENVISVTKAVMASLDIGYYILYYTIILYIILYCILYYVIYYVIYYIILYYIILYYIILYYIILYIVLYIILNYMIYY
jgi:hypothetical protein